MDPFCDNVCNMLISRHDKFFVHFYRHLPNSKIVNITIRYLTIIRYTVVNNFSFMHLGIVNVIAKFINNGIAAIVKEYCLLSYLHFVSATHSA